jgi:hypothetical protein
MYKALRSFTGIVSMHTNEIKEIKDEVVANDLVHAGYVVKVEVPEKIDLSGKPIENEEKEEVVKKPTSHKKKK